MEIEMTSKHAIDVARDIIFGDREKTYGHPAVNLRRIAAQWRTYINQKYGVKVAITEEDICWMMVLLKMSRQMNEMKQDNLVDAIGYLALIDRINFEGEEK
jgi:hypothetical protein